MATVDPNSGDLYYLKVISQPVGDSIPNFQLFREQVYLLAGTMKLKGGASASKGGITLTVDGGATIPATGSKGYVTIPYAGTITNWYIVGDTAGDCVVDLKRSGTSIVGSGNKPTLSSEQRANAAVSGWTSTSISENDEIQFNLDSVATITRINLTVEITKA